MVYLLEGVLNHSGYESCQVGARELKAGVRVHLNQPRIKVLVNHEIIAKYFKRESLSSRIKLPRNSTHRVLC